MTLKTYNAEQVATILFVHKNRVLEWACSGDLLGIKLGKSWVFREEDVAAFLDRKLRERNMGGAAKRSRHTPQSLAIA